MKNILHIAPRVDWDESTGSTAFEAASLGTEGFIHCSTADQVIEVANRLFRGLPGLVLLVIAHERVPAEIRYENLEGGDVLYPHIYGPIPRHAVVRVVDFPPGRGGFFELPLADFGPVP